MWAALKADMSEFVSTVKAETTEKLNIIDQGLDDVNDDYNDASDAMIDLGTGMVIEDDNNDYKQSSTLPSKEEMLEYLHSCDAVFLEPLSEKEEATMANFQLDAKTQEITQLLEDYPDSLRATFEELTSEVEYAEFWKRYYCRCVQAPVEETYARFYKEKRGPSALTSVTKFLGGAVARLVEEGEEVSNRTGEASAKSALGFLTGGGRPPFVLNTAVDSDDDEEYDGEQNGEEEEEEDFGWGSDEDEEGPEDVEEDDGGEVVEFKDTEKENLKEKLEQALEERNQLQKTIEMQAAEIKELKVKATEEKEEAPAPPAEPAPAADAALKEELEALKMELFEKDSELAGLKLKMEDNTMEHQHQREEISEQMQAHLQEKDKAIASLQAQLNALKENAANANDALLAQTKKENHELQTSLNDFVQRWQQQEAKNTKTAQALEESQAENERLIDEVKALKDQLAALQKDLETATATVSEGNDDDLQGELLQAKQQISTLQQEASSANSQLDGMREENLKLARELEGTQFKVQDLNQSLDQAKSLLQQAASSTAEMDSIAQEKEALLAELQAEKAKRTSLEEELESSKALLQQTQAELETKTHDSAGSQSTGFKVDSSEAEEPQTTDVEQENGANDEDVDGDDWGDDW